MLLRALPDWQVALFHCQPVGGEVSCTNRQVRQAESLSKVNFTVFQSSCAQFSKCSWTNHLYEPCYGPDYQIEDESFVCCS